jgi:6,7-dimethyl-8-ribityllumazine synthase
MGTAADNQGTLSADGFEFALLASRYNEQVVAGLIAGARAAWRAHGGSESKLRLEHVPGAFELPLAARRFALTGKVQAVIALGCVIRGETAHFDFVAGECARGLQRVALDTGVPVSFGVLTVDNLQQALARAANDSHNKGTEALETALAMAQLLRRI